MMTTSTLIRHPFGFLTIADKPSLKDLKEYYASRYYQEERGAYSLQHTEEEKNWISAKIEQRQAVLRNICPEARTMLDVGCGEGFILSFFRRSGWQVKGFDFSAAGLKAQNPTCLDVLVTGDLFDLLESECNSSRKYDIVWLQNVLEHVLEPVDFVPL